MTRLPRIDELTPESAGFGFFLCVRKDVRTTKSGNAFMLLTLQDVSGTLQAKLFDDFARYRDEFDVGDFVKVDGRAEVYNGRLELVVQRIRRVAVDQDRDDGFDEGACIQASRRDVGEMWHELTSRIGAVRDAGIRALLLRVAQDHETQLRIWPAAMVVHHAYRSGLLEHVLQVARVCRALGEIYEADQDLLFAGALLHDIGKVRELEYDRTTSYSREGNLVGHIALGLMMVRDAGAGLASLSTERLTEIEHLIASHHGQRELGSPVEPMSQEAFILAAADDLDARLHQVKRHITDDEGSGEFTAYHPRLGRVFLKPGPSRP